jgi:hypothetical protein
LEDLSEEGFPRTIERLLRKEILGTGAVQGGSREGNVVEENTLREPRALLQEMIAFFRTGQTIPFGSWDIALFAERVP